jgi:CRISPR-associated endonuclease/helicase Cas3
MLSTAASHAPPSATPYFWAKTLDGDTPGISVRDHCLNVGCVAEGLIQRLPERVRALLPPGAATLAALHDVGKISTGFQSKSPSWLQQSGLAEAARAERWREGSESDHAKVSQYVLERVLKPFGAQLWAVAAGAHHGRIFGRRIAESSLNRIPLREAWEKECREALLRDLEAVLGALPQQAPPEGDAELWCVAGLIAVADWIGSNEAFFSAAQGMPPQAAREAAKRALEMIRWGGGKARAEEFGALFGGYSPKPLQTALHSHATQAGLFIVEGPMGCGKTEAALWAAHRLAASGVNEGFFFALPTQVTSNRIHLRVARFLESSLEETTTLRLAHGASWLEKDQTLVLHPSTQQDGEADEHVREGRSWFASAKHALLARHGVGTVDQALQGVVAVKHFFVRRFGLAGKVVILDEVHSYDVYTGTLISHLIRELLALRCTVIILSATLTQTRRRELLQAAGAQPAAELSAAYPLVTVARPSQPLMEQPVEAGASRRIEVKTSALSQEAILEECVRRAESGQHVLYLRNTVVEAQEACRAMMNAVRADRVEVALLHSRFIFRHRQQLEEKWLERLGKQRAADGRGSILVATQVVEQSVDIDLDFIVSDLAPMDMLLQRMGRLWRHERGDRAAPAPEFWINVPPLAADATAKELKRSLGRSGLVYAPYVLVRTAEVLAGRESLRLPDEIREVLEATYAPRTDTDEPEAWKELLAAVHEKRAEHEALATSMTRVFAQQSQQDLEGRLTRLNNAPTRDLVLLKSCEAISRDEWRITPMEGESFTASSFEWQFAAAKVLHENLVRVPRHLMPSQPMPPWLKQHTHGLTAVALVQASGTLFFPEVERQPSLAYSPQLGLHAHTGGPIPYFTDDDDEFDY